MQANFKNMCWACAVMFGALLLQTAEPMQDAPPLVPGVYRIGGSDYAISWTGPVCVVDPQNGSPWTGEGRMVAGKLEIRWHLDTRPALGVYEIAADRRSATGAWCWIGGDSQHAETLTRCDHP